MEQRERLCGVEPTKWWIPTGSYKPQGCVVEPWIPTSPARQLPNPRLPAAVMERAWLRGGVCLCYRVHYGGYCFAFFIDLVIDHLTGSGIMEPDRLYESPFTDIDHRGVSGLFPAADVKVLVGILNDVRNRAAA